MVKIGTRKEFYKSMGGKEFFGKDDCPFCDIEGQKGHTIWKGSFWYIAHNLYPYNGTEKHIMAIPYKHRIYSTDLTHEELAELKDIYSFAKNFFGKENYFSFTRETMAIRSVEHFHIHFVHGKLQGSYLRKMLQNQGFPIVENLDLKK